ncbi:MAG TPA: FAD-dependent oxidoreductase, partial [Gammaproteobacteria bacterium]|nr:FAD-dependent oxidoreductase [Gammaproteobacteria bacterium]
MTKSTSDFDVLIVGSGASGLSLALALADHVDVAIVSKSSLEESATFYAQGGVSAVVDQT